MAGQCWGLCVPHCKVEKLGYPCEIPWKTSAGIALDPEEGHSQKPRQVWVGTDQNFSHSISQDGNIFHCPRLELEFIKQGPSLSLTANNCKIL